MRPVYTPETPRQSPQTRAPDERVRDFDEIDVGLTPAQALVEAQRCVQCANPPCAVIGCPLGNQIPRWIDHVVVGRIDLAAQVLSETTAMPEMCGKLCPQESLCEKVCVVGQVARPVSIGRLEEYVSRTAREKGLWPAYRGAPTGHRVAVIGSGPAGLAAADRLLTLGHDVVIFEKLPVPGGVPIYGIPSFKYAKDRVAELVTELETRGAEIRCSVELGRDLTVDQLLDADSHGFGAVILAVGAPRGRGMDVPGMDLRNIHMATDFLINGNLPTEQLRESDRMTIEVGKTCAVIGGGDTGSDCVRTAVRLGFEKVVCIYRRSQEEIPGREADRHYAAQEGVEYHFLATPIRFEGTEHVERMVCQKVQLGTPDDSGRRRPEPVQGSEFTVDVDAVVLALGYQLDTELLEGSGCELNRGWLTVDTGLATSRPGVFAAGDVVNGADLIVTAARDGRDVAMTVDRYLRGA